MQRVLLSGFEPFDGLSENPSGRIVSHLAKERFQGAEVRCVILPVAFASTFEELSVQIDEFSPDWVISFGLDRRAKELRLERIAANWIDAKRPDNRGEQPRAQKIAPQGQDGIFSSLPVIEINQGLRAAGFPVEITNLVGDHVCNFLFYKLMQRAVADGFRAGFVHVPAIPEMRLPEVPTLELSVMAAAAKQLVEICLASRQAV